MCTEQKYGEGANNAPTSEQPAPLNGPAVNTDQQALPTADERLLAKQYAENAESLKNEHESLLDLADGLIVAHKEHPVNVITHLLEFWLLNGGQNLSNNHSKVIVSGALQTIRNLHDIETCVQSIYYFMGEMRKNENGQLH